MKHRSFFISLLKTLSEMNENKITARVVQKILNEIDKFIHRGKVSKIVYHLLTN